MLMNNSCSKNYSSQKNPQKTSSSAPPQVSDTLFLSHQKGEVKSVDMFIAEDKLFCLLLFMILMMMI